MSLHNLHPPPSPPVKCPYNSKDIFPSIQNDILLFNKNESCVLPVGDMDARTADLSDYLDTSGNKYIDTCHITFHCAQPLITTKR